MKLQELNNISQNYKTRQKKMPVLFIGHGHPINAVLDNNFTRTLTRLVKTLDEPNAILVISAHWETVGTYVSVNPSPRTIYDFGRFDDRLFQLGYEAPGAPEIAQELKNMVSITDVLEDADMGLDHGAWTILKFIRPKADIPVFEMSIDYTLKPYFHFELGAQLKSLRERGILIICSGNIVHNLRLTDWYDINATPYEWNLDFDSQVKRHLDDRNFTTLINYDKMGTPAMLSVPMNDHYLPMLYSLGLANANEPITHIYEGYQYAAMSMRCFQIG